jgi:hypothetical protein
MPSVTGREATIAASIKRPVNCATDLPPGRSGFGSSRAARDAGKRSPEALFGFVYEDLFGKNPSRIVGVSLIPWRSSRPNPSLDRQQSRVERVGVGTRHDPFQ